MWFFERFVLVHSMFIVSCWYEDSCASSNLRTSSTDENKRNCGFIYHVILWSTGLVLSVLVKWNGRQCSHYREFKAQLVCPMCIVPHSFNTKPHKYQSYRRNWSGFVWRQQWTLKFRCCEHYRPFHFEKNVQSLVQLIDDYMINENRNFVCFRQWKQVCNLKLLFFS